MKAIVVTVLSVLLLPLSLSAEDSPYEKDWKAFVKEMNGEYPFFQIKQIKGDWSKKVQEWTKRVEKCENDGEFLTIVSEAIACLRDGHAGIIESTAPLPRKKEYMLPFSMMPATNNMVVVMELYGNNRDFPLKPGTVVVSIDGVPVRQFLNAKSKEIWEEGGAFSSPQRAGMYAYRMPCRSEKTDEHAIVFLDEGGAKKSLTIANDMEARGWSHVYNMPAGLKQMGGGVSYTLLPDDVGYIYMRQIKGAETEKAVSGALATAPEAKHWIVDLRGNGGGGYDASLIKAFERMPEPFAVICDAGCFSAGETLVRDLKAGYKVKVFGSTTAGSSSAKKQWKFPSGMATVVFSIRGRQGERGKTIEFYGMKPDVVVEAVPEEVAAGKNSEILRAQEFLLGK